MKRRWSLWAFVCVLTACSGGSRPGLQPTPSPSVKREGQDTARTSVNILPSPPAPAVPVSGEIGPVRDSTGLAQEDADSAADAQILEQLAMAHPEAQDTGNEDGGGEAIPGGANAAATAEVTYDIDVSTYGAHARVQDYLDFFQGPARERFSIWLQRMPRYEAMIRAKLRENGVPEDMVYLALIESGFSNSAVSRARAAGMWQFIKGTGKLYGLRIDSWVDERRDPIRSTDAAARHLADLRDRFGSMYLAAAAYNAGAGKVNRGLRRLGGDEEDEEDNPDATFFRLYDTRFLRRETRDYVPKLIAAALIAKQPEKYGFEKPVGIAAMSYDSIFVPDATGLDVLARLADTSLAALRELNPHFLRLVTPPRQQAIVRIPAGSADLVTARYAALEPESRVSFVEHVIARGQTLAGIARSYRVSTRLIADANPGLRMTRLRPGMRLVIPTSFVPTLPEPAVATPRRRAAPAAGSTTIRYRVRGGESLWTIAQEHGTSVGELRSLNALTSAERLRAGQVIRVPVPLARTVPPARVEATDGKTHLVRRGETLSAIASRYRVPLSSLLEANRLSATSLIKAGSRITIP
jgi:membrane-bound lytic murein transglycosylase D